MEPVATMVPVWHRSIRLCKRDCHLMTACGMKIYDVIRVGLSKAPPGGHLPGDGSDGPSAASRAGITPFIHHYSRF